MDIRSKQKVDEASDHESFILSWSLESLRPSYKWIDVLGFTFILPLVCQQGGVMFLDLLEFCEMSVINRLDG